MQFGVFTLVIISVINWVDEALSGAWTWTWHQISRLFGHDSQSTWHTDVIIILVNYWEESTPVSDSNMYLLYDWVWVFLCDSGGKTRTKDKYRVVYTDQQRLELEREFQHNRYITMRRKTELSVELGLSERQVGGLQSKLKLGVEREQGGEIGGSRGRVTMQESRWQSEGDDLKRQERMWRKNGPQTQQQLRCLITMHSVAVVSVLRPRFGSNPSPIDSNSVYTHKTERKTHKTWK